MTTVAVAIQGEAGSFSHAAALQALGPDIRLVPCPSFEELFRAVEQRDAARGAVPIENSLAGSVHENYDLLGASFRWEHRSACATVSSPTPAPSGPSSAAWPPTRSPW